MGWVFVRLNHFLFFLFFWALDEGNTGADEEEISGKHIRKCVSSEEGS